MLEQLEDRTTPSSVTNLSVTSGPTAGGTALLINGSGFTGATAVSFGDAAASFSVESDTAVSVTAPAHAAGYVDVRVTAPGGESPQVYADMFAYNAPPAPYVGGLTVHSGPAAGGTTLQVGGSGFSGATAVSFGAGAVPSFTVLSDTAISVTTPAGSAGTVYVTVTAPGGTSNQTYGGMFTYVTPASPPAVTLMSPNSGTTAGGAFVQISGSGFTDANGYSDVTGVNFGGMTSSMYYVMGANVIDAYAPAEAAGTVDVTVTTAAGTSAVTTADQFTYVTPPPPPPPAVTLVSPNSGTTAGGAYVQISGSGFTGTNGYSDVTAVSFGGVASSMYYLMGANVIDAYAPAEAAGVVDVTVTTAAGMSAAAAGDQFTYVAPPPPPPPVVAAVTPPTGSTAGGAFVEIDGSGFIGAGGVSFGSVASAMYYLVNDGVIDA